jgi:iron complex outermembrane recepter protein
MNRILFVILIFFIFANRDIFSEKRLPDITVKNNVILDEESIERSTGFADIIKRDEINSGITTLAELLSGRAGVQIKRYGGMGSCSTISIRGVNPNEVIIYINNIPITDALLGEVNLGDIPIDNIERIEIYRGNAPASFATPGIGGIINIVTKKKIDKRISSFTVGYGSFGSSKILLNHGDKIDDLTYHIFLNRDGSRGDYKYIDDNGTPVFNSDDDFERERINNKYVSYSLSGDIAYLYKNYNILLSNTFFYKEKGIPGLMGNIIEDANVNIKRNVLLVQIERKDLFNKKLNFKIRSFYNIKVEEYEDEKNELNINSDSMKGYYDRAGSELFFKIFFLKYAQELNVNFGYNQEEYLKKDNLSEDITQKRKKCFFSIEDNISFFEDSLRVTPQFRGEYVIDNYLLYNNLTESREDIHNSKFLTGENIGVRFFILKEKLYFKSNIGRSYRFPLFTELFGDNIWVKGNPELKHETSMNRDIGFGIRIKKKKSIFKKILFEYSYFNNNIDDIIIFIYNSQFSIIGLNAGKANIQGHEFMLSTIIFSFIDVSSNYPFQEAIDEGDLPYYKGEYLPHRPMHEFSGNIRFFNKSLSLGYGINFIASNYRDRQNSEFYKIESRVIHNLIFNLKVYNTDISIEAKNFTNNMVRDSIGSPLPGRSFYAKLSAKI